MQTVPDIKNFLFDFSEPYKIDLERFMSHNYRFNLPIEKFAKLTGRSLAGFKRDFQKAFNTSPRNWLQEKRLTEVYLELGFESLPHFSNAFKQMFGVTPSRWSAQL